MQANIVIQPQQIREEEDQLYDRGTERAFLCCLMMKPALMVEAERLLPPDRMFSELNRYVYQCMQFIYRNAAQHGWPLQFDSASMLAVVQYMPRQHYEAFMQKTDGMQQVKAIEALRGSVHPDQFYQFVAVLNDCATRVFGYRHCREVQLQFINKQQYPSGQLVAAGTQFQELAFDVMGRPDKRITLMADAEDEFAEKILLQRAFPNDNFLTVPVNQFPWWMERMGGGYRRKGLTLVCARPKVGKSTLLLNLAIAAAVAQGFPVLYMDTEMSREEMFSREIAHLSDIHEHKIIRGHFMDQDVDKNAVNAAIRSARKSKLFYINVAGSPLHQIQSAMRQFAAQHVGTFTRTHPTTGKPVTFSNPALIIYDWMKLPDAGSLGEAKEYQAIGFLASGIKDTAGEIDIPVVGAAQNNRDALSLSPQDWEFSGERVVSASDRLAQFCTQLCVLRNIMPEEEEELAAHGLIREGYEKRPDDPGRFMFNQILHIFLQRAGSNFSKGIPLYLDRGKARYTEMAFEHDPSGGVKMELDTESGLMLPVETKSMHHLRRRFADQAAAKAAKKASSTPALPNGAPVTTSDPAAAAAADKGV